ncbi:Cohesin domain-containing protein [Ruminococcaceae bacterium FB2012]|nr:Cohesin domain-containing protein [Ruminococcaceae bacterium FB2012]
MNNKNKKRFIAAVTAAVLIFGCAPESIRQLGLLADSVVKASAEGEKEPGENDSSEFVTYGDYVTVENGTGLTIVGYTGSDRNLTIPEELGGKTVTQIGEEHYNESGEIEYDLWSGYVFAQTYHQSNETLRSVSIPSSVEKIAPNAFGWCTKLQTVTFSEGLKEIGRSAFSMCPLRTLALPDSLEVIGERPFDIAGERVTTLKLPKNLKTVGEEAFVDFTKVTELTLPDGLQKIGKSAFSGVNESAMKITELVIPDSVTEIGEDAFGDCSALTKITLSKNLKRIEKETFWRAPITELTIPEGVEYIGEDAFNAENITSLTIPSTIKHISDDAFSGAQIEQLVIPGDIDYLSGFNGCTKLKSVTVNGYVKELGNSAFDSGWNYAAQQNNPSELTTFKTKGIGKIDRGAFGGCNKLTSFDLTGVTEIGEKAFAESGLTEITIPSTIKTVPKEAFWSCRLEKVVLEEGVEEIGYGAFCRNYTLRSITLPDSLYKVGAVAFAFCPCGDVYLSDNLDEIGKGAFAVKYHVHEKTGGNIIDGFFDDCHIFCNSNTYASDYLEDLAETLGIDMQDGMRYTFLDTGETNDRQLLTYNELADGTLEITGTTGLMLGAVIPEKIDGKTVTRIGEGAFAGAPGGWMSGIQSDTYYIEMPDTVTSIADFAFQYCINLRSLKLSKNLKTIGNYTFDYAAFESLDLPNGLENIGYSAFSGCTNLKEITIPESVKQSEDTITIVTNAMYGITKEVCLSDAWFTNCTSLEKVTLPSGFTFIGDECFRGCNSLEEFVIPEGITKIGKSAFANCFFFENGGIGLKKVVFPSTLKEIGDCAFTGDILLGSLDLPEGLETIGDSAFDSTFVHSMLYGKTDNGYEYYLKKSPVTKLVIPDTVKSIGEKAFICSNGFELDGVTYGAGQDEPCTSITEIKLSSSLEEIGNAAFYGIPIESIELPASLKKLNGFANTKLKSVTIPDGVEEIGAYAFDSTPLEGTVVIPRSVKKIGEYALNTGYYLHEDGKEFEPKLEKVLIYNSELEFDGGKYNDPSIGSSDILIIYGFPGSTADDYAYRIDAEFRPLTVSEDDAQLTLTDAEVTAGDTFTVDLSIKNNPGLISYMLNVEYDRSYLTLVKAESVDFKGTTFGPTYNHPFVISWADALNGDNDTDGAIARLTFEVDKKASDGYTNITASIVEENTFNNAHIDRYIWNCSNEVTVIARADTHIPGDIDGSGKANMRDVTSLQRYLNGWNVEVDETALDINGDGKTNMRDLTCLQRYLNGWDVEIY